MEDRQLLSLGGFSLLAGGTDDTGPAITAQAPVELASNDSSLEIVRLTFNDVIDTSSFAGVDDVVLKDPQGFEIAPVTVSSVVGSGDTQFDLTFAAQSLRGQYRLTVGPDILDLAGNPMNQDGDATNGESADSYLGTVQYSPTVAAVPSPPAEQLYFEDFESWSSVPSSWHFKSDGDGTVTTVTSGGPHDSSHLFIENTPVASSQWAGMAVDLSDHVGETDLWLDFWAKQTDSGTNNGNLFVNLSPDGQSWHTVYYGDPETVYQQYTLDLDDEFGAAGIDLASDGHVFVRFGYASPGGTSLDYDVYLDDVGIRVGDGVGPAVISQNPTSLPADGGPLNNIRIEFDEPIDLTTFAWADDVLLADPFGTVLDGMLTPVTGSNNTQFDLTFPDQSLRGQYRFNIGPDVRDLAGNPMDQNKDGILGGVTDVYSQPISFQSTTYVPASATTDLLIEDFEDWSTVPSYWSFSTVTDGTWSVESNTNVFSGGHELYSITPLGWQSATLKADLSTFAGREDLFFDFWIRGNSAAMVELSGDGVNWVRWDWFSPSDYFRRVMDLDAFALNNGISLDDDVYLRFEHGQRTVPAWNSSMALDYVRLLAGPPRIDVVLPQTSITENDGDNAASVYVIRSNTLDFSAPVSVTLTSSDPSELVVDDTDGNPATEIITIPAGASFVELNLDAVDDQLLDSTQTVTVSATAEGFIGGSDTVDVNDHETLTVTIPDPSIAEGETIDAVVTRSNAEGMANPLTVNLASSDPAQAQVPSSVTIPADVASATFPLTGVDDALIDGTHLVTISATAPTEPSYIPVADSIHVEDIQGPTLTLDIPLTAVGEEVGGKATTATVTRSGDTSSAMTVTLYSRSEELWFPANIVIPAGSATAEFDVYVVNDPARDGTQDVLVAAYLEDHSYARGVDSIDVVDDDAPGAMTIGGRLRGTLPADTYEVLTNIEVLAGTTLSLEAGATLKFHEDTTLSVTGTLLAEGEEGAPVRFTSAAAVPSAGNWEGIHHRYGSGSPRTLLDHVEIAFAHNGLEISNAHHPALTVSNADIHDNEWYGIYAIVGDGDDITSSDLLIVDCRIHDNGQDGILLRSSSHSGDSSNSQLFPTIRGNEIFDNAAAGINLLAEYDYDFMQRARKAVLSPQVTQNLIHGNQIGVYGRAYEASGAVGNATIEGAFSNNLIVANLGDGMRFSRTNTGKLAPDIINNTIAMNGGNGITHAVFRTYSIVRNNIVTGNTSGIRASEAFGPDANSTENNNVWGNTTANWVNYPSTFGSPTTTNSNGTPADTEMNISEDPQFRTDLADADFYRLHWFSACVDAGTTSGAPATDYRSKLRISPPDIGAHESRAVVLQATSNNDNITVTAGSVGKSEHQVQIGSETTTYDPGVYDEIWIDGLDGNDTITIVGTNLNEQAALEADSVYVSGENYEFGATDVEAITVDAGTGDDTVTMTGSAASHRLYSYPEYAVLTDSTRSFRFRAEAFDTVNVDLPAGGRSSAYLHDSPGKDTLDADPEQVMLKRGVVGSSADSVTTLTGFERVYGFATQGNEDEAVLTGAEMSGNRFYGYGSHTALTESRRSFYFYVRGFDSVAGESPGGGYSYAYLHDSSGDDSLIASPGSATINRPDVGSDATASGFTRLYAYSRYGGNDTAELEGNEAGGNYYRGFPAYSTMTDRARSYYHYVRGFHTVTAIGSEDDPSGDRAYLYDSRGNDFLSAFLLEDGQYQGALLSDADPSTGTEASYELRVKYFDLVYARSSDSGTEDSIEIDHEEQLAYWLIRSGSW